MKITIVTGLCGSGKTTYCKDKNPLTYDSIYHYATYTVNYIKVAAYLDANKNSNELYLDAFNVELLEYLKIKLLLSIDDINVVILYTDIDDYYETLAYKEPRQFNLLYYDDYVRSILNDIKYINTMVLNLKINNVTYKYRKDNTYTDYNNDEHLNTILNENKQSRLLRFIDTTSGDKNYQSIILNNEYIRKGTEQDWLTFENILKCTALKDKVVCDIGCFNGYFSFKSISEGAKKVIGIDHNSNAINICNKLAYYNHYHLWKDGIKTDVSSELGIHFYLKKIGKDIIFSNEIIETKIDVIFALNYLHHLKNDLGEKAFLDTVDSFFKNASEVIFEVNEKDINDIHETAIKNNFKLVNRIESHRKTMFGNRSMIYFKENVI